MTVSNYPDTTWSGDPLAPWNQPDPPECLNVRCCAELSTDWRFCPYCGERIDWEADEYRKVEY